MNPKIKNAIIFIAIGAAVILVYVFFIKGTDDNGGSNLVSSPNSTGAATSSPSTTAINPAVGGEFLSLLLSVKSIKLNDSIFESPSFQALRDSSITLTPDGTEGRPNPFAPFGQENITSTSTTTTTTNTTNTSSTNSLLNTGTTTAPPAGKKTN
jgi:hypothetical protein